jgi:hypothetical protein
MKYHLVECFQKNKGRRGVTFYDDERCNFLDWQEVYCFLEALPRKENTDPFCEKLEETLANYNPDTQFLAVHQKGEAVSVELYTHLR